MKENKEVADTNVGDIEEAIERLEYIDRTYSCNNYYSIWDLKCIEILLSDYKRLLKENELYKKNSEIMSKENLSTAEQLKVEIKENFRLKNQLENNRKEYQETYKDVREELKELKKENEELKEELETEQNERLLCHIRERQMIPVQKIKDKIEELDIKISECEYSDDDDEEYKKAVEKDKLFLLNQKRVLQELLEKRR